MCIPLIFVSYTVASRISPSCGAQGITTQLDVGVRSAIQSHIPSTSGSPFAGTRYDNLPELRRLW
jgi:hypothetical protein